MSILSWDWRGIKLYGVVNERGEMIFTPCGDPREAQAFIDGVNYAMKKRGKRHVEQSCFAQ